LYDERLPVLGDWDFNVRFFEQFDVVHVDRPLAYYHHRYESEGPMANTIVTGHDDVRRRLLNRYLREDLAAGRLGKGYLANLLHDERERRDYDRAWYDDQAESIRQLELEVRKLFDDVHTGLRHVDGDVLGLAGRVDRLQAAVDATLTGKLRRQAGRTVRALRPRDGEQATGQPDDGDTES
jgi:hypothetical protein